VSVGVSTLTHVFLSLRAYILSRARFAESIRRRQYVYINSTKVPSANSDCCQVDGFSAIAVDNLEIDRRYVIVHYSGCSSGGNGDSTEHS
jgi:hypothetical protein